MVNARVNSAALDGAIDVIKRQGTTLSEVIRNTIEYITRTKTIPPSALPFSQDGASPERVRALSRYLEALPMPGRSDTAGLTDGEILEQELLRRYGY